MYMKSLSKNCENLFGCFAKVKQSLLSRKFMFTLSWIFQKFLFKVKTTQSEFVNFIKLCYKKSDLLAQIVETEKKVVRDYKKASTNRVLLKTMRMTIVGFD